MDTYRIVLADDHVLFRQGLKGIIERRKSLEVIGEAGDGLELLKILRTSTPDMVIVDISMPKMRGLEAVRQIKARHPQVKVLILTMHKDRSYLHQAIAAGAEGYLVKEDADPDLFTAIERLRQGKVFVTSHLAEEMTEDWANMRRGKAGDTSPEELLTAREKEVIKLIVDGKSSREIGELLFISVRTVERHRANIMDKLQIKKAADLIKYAIQQGFG